VVQIFFVRLRDLRGFVMGTPQATPAASNPDEVASLRGRKNV
jgi:hypothetical protein